MILLDSDVMIELIQKRSKRGDELLKLIRDQQDEDICIPSIVLQEVLFGIVKSTKLTFNDIVRKYPLLNMPIISFGKDEAIIAAKIEVEMESLGKKKPRGDLLIASMAITNSAKLISLNLVHYEDIPGLDLIK